MISYSSDKKIIKLDSKMQVGPNFNLCGSVTSDILSKQIGGPHLQNFIKLGWGLRISISRGSWNHTLRIAACNCDIISVFPLKIIYYAIERGIYFAVSIINNSE